GISWTTPADFHESKRTPEKPTSGIPIGRSRAGATSNTYPHPLHDALPILEAPETAGARCPARRTRPANFDENFYVATRFPAWTEPTKDIRQRESGQRVRITVTMVLAGKRCCFHDGSRAVAPAVYRRFHRLGDQRHRHPHAVSPAPAGARADDALFVPRRAAPPARGARGQHRPRGGRRADHAGGVAG